MTLVEVSIANQVSKTFPAVIQPPVHSMIFRLWIPNSGTTIHIFSTWTSQHILILPPSHIFDSHSTPHVSKIRNSNNRRNLYLKPVAAKMFLNHLITGDIVELVEKTSDLGNESYKPSIVLCTLSSLPQFQNNATKYSGSTLRSSWLRYKTV